MFVIIKSRLVQSNEFQDYHTYRKYVCLVDVVLDLVLHIIQIVKLFRCEDEAIDEISFRECFVVTAVPVLVVDVE